MKNFIGIVLLPFLLQCGSKSSKAEMPEPNDPPSTDTASDQVPTPTAPKPLPIVTPVPGNPAPDPSQSASLSVNFNAKVGSENLLCFDKSDALLQRGQIFTDLRFFVSNLALVDEQGKEVFVQLNVAENGSNLQHIDANQNSIALLNFLEAACATSDATKKTKNSLEGSINQGSYKELRFQLGLPYAPMNEALARIPAALAPSDMGWMWEHFPADIQIEMHTGKSKKILNALTSVSKRVISLPIKMTQTEAGQTIDLRLDLSKLFPTTGADFVNGVESACNNSNKTIDESASNCAYAFKAFGLEVANPKQPFVQTVFSLGK